MRLCTEGAEHAAIVASFGNPNAASDVRVAVEVLGAGLRGGKANVEINLQSLQNPRRTEEIRGEVLRLTQKFEAEIESVVARL
jgi:formiminotetrahydrofolate cyclodeaminase